MRNIARRAGRFAIVPVLAGVAVLGVAAPAAAAPPAPQPQATEENCSEPVDGVSFCVVVDKTDPASAKVSALVRSAAGNLKGALVVLEACDGVNCTAQEVATGKNTAQVRTRSQEWGRGVGYYRANASWVGADNKTHTGSVHPD